MTADEFAALLFHVPPEFLHLRACLPVYPNAEVQRAWAGNSDVLLAQQTALFSRLLSDFSRRFRHQALESARILDYGCGWGRLLRQMLYFSDPDSLFGLDPWDKSLEQCSLLRVPGTILPVPYRPCALPDAITSIDLAFSFSIFTHIGEANASEILRCVRAVAAPNGLFVVTIRPVEYWIVRSKTLGEVAERMVESHQNKGYAFLPSGASRNAGSEDYGEASYTTDRLARIASEAGWRVVASEWLMIDPYQHVVCLQAA